MYQHCRNIDQYINVMVVLGRIVLCCLAPYMYNMKICINDNKASVHNNNKLHVPFKIQIQRE